jgi:nucleoside 2-deoxyribosyltransferase
MEVYLAAPYIARDALREYAADLELVGMGVTSRWLKEDHALTPGNLGAAPEVDADAVRQHCEADFADIYAADVVVVFTGSAIAAIVEGVESAEDARLHTGGRHVETGYALALGKPVVVIGTPENVFHRGAARVVPSWHRAVLELCAMERAGATRIREALS